MDSPGELAFPHLQAPFALRGRPLRNRLMHASIVTLLSDRGRLTQRLVDYYVSRARGGAALIVTEPVSMVARQDVPNWVRAWTPEAEDDLRRWAAAVEAEDTGCWPSCSIAVAAATCPAATTMRSARRRCPTTSA